LAEVAEASNLPRTTVHRIVSALEAQQLIISDVGGVRLGRRCCGWPRPRIPMSA
jgi:DNA-binding IclR family transcriptional regulator